MSGPTVEARRTYAGESAVTYLLDQAVGGPSCVIIGGSTVVLSADRKFASVDSIQDYCDRVLALRQVRARFPDVRPVRVVRKRDNALRATYRAGEIRIPAQTSIGGGWAMRETVVLHELAHHVSPSGEGHGPVFRDNLAFLLGEAVGPEVALALRLCWHGEGL